MGVYRDRNQTRSCSSVYGHPPEICPKQGNKNHQKENQQISKQKIYFLARLYWDRKGIWGKDYFVSTIGIKKEVIRKYAQLQAKEETGQAQLDF